MKPTGFYCLSLATYGALTVFRVPPAWAAGLWAAYVVLALVTVRRLEE